MSTPLTAKQLAKLAETISAALGEPEPLATLRRKAAVLAEELPLPDPALERPWKYFDPRTVPFDEYEPARPSGTQDPAALMASFRIDPEEYAGIAIQSNSDVLRAESRAEGLRLAPLDAVPPELRERIAAAYGAAVPFDRSRLVAMHYAFARGGLAVITEPNADVRQPVRVTRWFEGPGQLAAPHTLVIAGPNSRVSVIEDCRSADDAIVVLPVVEVLPGPGAEVRYSILHRWGASTYVFGEQRVVTERDAAFVGLFVATGGRVVKSHIEASLVGRGSSSELFGLTLADDHEHVDFYTLQDHVGPDTRSDLLFKSALKDHARAVYYGLTRVGLEARNADANQENRNLLLSKTAKADSDPVLEILTNNVIRASHGATAGPVDEEQLFYLQSRGIPRPAAEEMLVWAFLGEVLDRLPDDALRQEVIEILQAKLEA